MILDEVTTFLGTLPGVGTPGTDIFYGPMKQMYPDVVTLVEEYAGLPDEPAMSDSAQSGKLIRLEAPRIRIRVRGAKDDYLGPRAKAQTIRVAFFAVLNTTLSGVFYVQLEPLSPVRHLRTDDDLREELGFACQAIKELS